MLHYLFTSYSTNPSIFWLPAKHNDKTSEALKNTQDIFIEKDKLFREECQQKLEERLKLYDSKFQDLANLSQVKDVHKVKVEKSEELVITEEKKITVAPVDEEPDDNFGEDDLINEIYNMN